MYMLWMKSNWNLLIFHIEKMMRLIFVWSFLLLFFALFIFFLLYSINGVCEHKIVLIFIFPWFQNSPKALQKLKSESVIFVNNRWNKFFFWVIRHASCVLRCSIKWIVHFYRKFLFWISFIRSVCMREILTENLQKIHYTVASHSCLNLIRLFLFYLSLQFSYLHFYWISSSLLSVYTIIFFLSRNFPLFLLMPIEL